MPSAKFNLFISAPPLKDDERGLLMTAPSTVGSDHDVIIRGFDPQELRAAALFFDRIEVPKNNLIAMNHPDLDFLEQEGVAQQSLLALGPNFSVGMGEMLVRAANLTFDALEQRSPGQWALATGVNSIQVLAERSQPDEGAAVCLYNLLPVPDHDVPLTEVLEFKQRRRSELLRLRQEMDRVFALISEAEDPDSARQLEMTALDKAAADALKVGLEAKFPLRLTDWKVKLNLSRGVTWATGAFIGAQVALPALSAVLAGVTGAAALFDVSATAGWRGKPQPGPFDYLLQCHKELFRS
jgi:hypothetical protein